MGENENRKREQEPFEWREDEDLTALEDEELRDLLLKLEQEEREVSYRRRVLQGRMDLIRSEMVRRGSAALSPEELARVLMGDKRREDDPRGGS